jgi:isopenicillin-N epimerase
MESKYKKFFLLDPDVIFLNHGSFGATPLPVFETYQRWQRELEKQPVEFLDRRAPGLLEEARSHLAAYLGTQPDNLVFTCNATTGGNIVAHSLNLKPGDEVLATDHEYGAMDRTWWFLSEKQGFKYINYKLPFPLTDSKSMVDAFWQGVNGQTRAIFLSHITSPTGITLPVAELCARAREAGILSIVDGAHAPGQIPLDLEQVGADFYTGNLHKWLCAPKGSAFLYARPEKQHLIEPLIISWGYRNLKPGRSAFVDLLQWTGTRDLSPFLSVKSAIDFQKDHDWDQVRACCHELAKQAIMKINDLTGLPPIHNGDDTWYAQMAAVRIPDEADIVQLKQRLYEKYLVEIPLIEWNGMKIVRASFQAYNSPDDLAVLLTALKAEL